MTIESSIDEVTKHTIIGKTFIDGRRQSNAGAVLYNDFIVVIDPSPEARTARIFRKSIEEKYQMPVKYLLITHYHGDHTYGAIEFKDTIIAGSKQLLKVMKNKLDTDWKHKQQEIILPELIFSDKLVIRENNLEIHFIYAGGHTICSSYAYFPNEKVLFAGDLIFAKRFPWAGDPTCNPDQWIKVYEDFLKLDFDYLVPGHGPLVGREEVDLQMQLLKNTRDATIEAIRKNESFANIKRPEIYKESSNASTITRSLRHFYEFYSKKQ